MNTFNRLFVFSMLLCVASINLYAGIQIGRVLPDEINVKNDTNKTMSIKGRKYGPGETAHILTKNLIRGEMELRQGSKKTPFGILPIEYENRIYVIGYPKANKIDPVSGSYDILNINLSEQVSRSKGLSVREYQHQYTGLE